MKPNRSLVRKLAWTVLLKLLVLTAIWWAFIRDQKVTVDSETAAEHLLAPALSTPSKD
jgi:cbb3-type cytochrome oxidase subunit 3